MLLTSYSLSSSDSASVSEFSTSAILFVALRAAMLFCLMILAPQSRTTTATQNGAVQSDKAFKLFLSEAIILFEPDFRI